MTPAQVKSLVGLALNCHHVSQHLLQLVACPACVQRAIEAAVADDRDFQYLLGVEWGLKYNSKRDDWPQSWDAGFPGFKAQALLDRDALAKEVRERTP